MAISLEHKVSMVYIFLLDSYDSDGHLSGYSIRMAEYEDSITKWADDIGVGISMKIGEKWCQVDIIITPTDKPSRTLIQPEDDGI